MKILMTLNDAPYGSERSYNGLRLALNLLRMNEETDFTLFLMGDAVACAKEGQTTPQGYYNIGLMLKPLLKKSKVLLCGSCLDARGLRDAEMLEGTQRSSMDELTKITFEADKVIVF